MKVTINGKEIQVEESRTVLQAARDNGIFIPSLCDHDSLIPFGGCRVCLVQIKGRKGFVPSCSTYVTLLYGARIMLEVVRSPWMIPFS